MANKENMTLRIEPDLKAQAAAGRGPGTAPAGAFPRTKA